VPDPSKGAEKHEESCPCYSGNDYGCPLHGPLSDLPRSGREKLDVPKEQLLNITEAALRNALADHPERDS
jgi:hypothetical protein